MPNEAFCLPGNTSVQELLERQDEGLLPRGWIDGLTLSNDATDATNDIGIAAGCCRSTVNAAHEHNGSASPLPRHQRDLELPVGIIKQLDVLWAPDNYDAAGFSGGGRSGGRSASSLADSTWHAFAIGGKRVKTDIMLHDSVTQSSVLAALPGGYSAYRRIGSLVRASSAIKAFSQFGEKFLWSTPVLDLSAGTGTYGTSANSQTLTVPSGVVVEALLHVATGGDDSAIYVSALTSSDMAPSHSVAPLAQFTSASGSGGGIATAFTNTSKQVRLRQEDDVAIYVATLGWIDRRDRDS